MPTNIYRFRWHRRLSWRQCHQWRDSWHPDDIFSVPIFGSNVYLYQSFGFVLFLWCQHTAPWTNIFSLQTLFSNVSGQTISPYGDSISDWGLSTKFKCHGVSADVENCVKVIRMTYDLLRINTYYIWPSHCRFSASRRSRHRRHRRRWFYSVVVERRQRYACRCPTSTWRSLAISTEDIMSLHLLTRWRH